MSDDNDSESGDQSSTRERTPEEEPEEVDDDGPPEVIEVVKRDATDPREGIRTGLWGPEKSEEMNLPLGPFPRETSFAFHDPGDDTRRSWEKFALCFGGPSLFDNESVFAWEADNFDNDGMKEKFEKLNANSMRSHESARGYSLVHRSPDDSDERR